MKSGTSKHFDRSFEKFPSRIKKIFDKQIRFLLVDIRHPSLRAKKYDETEEIWQARVTNNVRFYFKIEGDTYQLIDIERHSD